MRSKGCSFEEGKRVVPVGGDEEEPRRRSWNDCFGCVVNPCGTYKGRADVRTVRPASFLVPTL